MKIPHQDFGLLTSNYQCKQWNSFDLLAEYAPANCDNILDLGCGDGKKIDRILNMVPGSQYVGVDIEDSPEVNSRTVSDDRLHSYDGINLPFAENTFDIVFSRQVFEHVRHQEILLRDIRRVLKPNGWFIGSLSGLEPYHSRSIFNLTPWGWMIVLNDNGFALETLRPGIDGQTLIRRAICIQDGTEFKPKYSNGNGDFNDEVLRSSRTPVEKNRLMLQFAGHIIFAGRSIKD